MSNFDLEALSEVQLVELVRAAADELKQRAIDRSDPDTLVDLAMDEMFTGAGDPAIPRIVAPGIIALAGSAIDQTTSTRKSKHIVVRLPEAAADYWAWSSDLHTLIHDNYTKVGKVHKSVALHRIVDGMVVVMYERVRKDNKYDTKGLRCWQLVVEADENGEIKESLVPAPTHVPSRIPPPDGDVDNRAYGNR